MKKVLKLHQTLIKLRWGGEWIPDDGNSVNSRRCWRKTPRDNIVLMMSWMRMRTIFEGIRPRRKGSKKLTENKEIRGGRPKEDHWMMRSQRMFDKYLRQLMLVINNWLDRKRGQQSVGRSSAWNHETQVQGKWWRGWVGRGSEEMKEFLLLLVLRSKSSAARTAMIFLWTSAAILSCFPWRSLSKMFMDVFLSPDPVGVFPFL